MNIFIQHISTDGDLTRVRFTSKHGSAEGVWRGETRPANKDYYVEILVTGVLTWDVDIRVSAHKMPAISLEGETVVIHGRLEHYMSETAIATLRLGVALVEAETIGQPFAIGTYITERIPVKRFELYDSGL